MAADFDLSDFSNIEPAQFAKMVKSVSDAQINEVLSGANRSKILDAIFGHMPGTFRPERAGSTNAVIHWNITGGENGPDIYELVIADGTCTLSPTPAAQPKVALTMSPVDFVKIVSGNGNPVMMFMTGKLKAKGDLGLASNIANLFSIPKA